MKASAHSRARQCYMDAGALEPVIDGFAISLRELGHTQLTIKFYRDSSRHFADWLCRRKIEHSAIDREVFDRFARHRCHCPGGRHQERLSARYVRRVRRFVRFLMSRGLLKADPPSARIVDGRVAAYQDWLRHHRGISERTIDRHGRMIVRLLVALGDNPQTYDAALVRRVIIDEAGRSSPDMVKTMTMALRGYLRFLAACGICRHSLDQAVPVIPQWRLSALPRYISGAEVERVVASCDLTKPYGIRDRAILLLLARLGLRAGDILAMRVSDVDWGEATFRVCGKGRREIRLPLPQDAGDALLAYLVRARPCVNDEHMFLRSSAPHRSFANAATVSSIVHLALKRAGIANPPSRGANLLRHSAATSMLRAGASLQAVGAVLRHKSIDTTAHYAKVDIGMLRQIAQPWPGEATC